MAEFEFPWQYHFPPFFTLQPNATTRQKQLESWSNFILEYCQVFRIYELDTLEAQQSSLFSNDNINRKLSKDGIEAVFTYLEKSKHIEWLDKGKRRCRVNWKTPEEWANVIYEWAVNNGFVNSVCTIFDLIHGDDSKNEAFHKIDQSVLMQALRHLQDNGKAELMNFNGNEDWKDNTCSWCFDDPKHESEVTASALPRRVKMPANNQSFLEELHLLQRETLESQIQANKAIYNRCKFCNNDLRTWTLSWNVLINFSIFWKKSDQTALDFSCWKTCESAAFLQSVAVFDST